MTNRLHVLSDGQRTCVVVTDEASVNAAVKRQLLAVAEQATLRARHCVAHAESGGLTDGVVQHEAPASWPRLCQLAGCQAVG